MNDEASFEDICLEGHADCRSLRNFSTEKYSYPTDRCPKKIGFIIQYTYYAYRFF